MNTEINGKYVVINSKFNCQSFPLNDKAIWVSDEDLEQIGITKCFDVKNNCVVDYDNTEDVLNEKISKLRLKREVECFSIINRGKLWYDNLTQEQLEELNKWYIDWLNVTETLIEPIKPEWIK
jgi:hypothetical protein